MSDRFKAPNVDALGQAYYVSVPDDVPAFACGANGAVWMSRDKGASWTAATSTGTVSDLWCGVFVDDLHGWAVGDDGAVVATQDGGRTWRAQQSGVDVTLRLVAFASPKLGCVIGDEGTMLTTSSSGRTWTLHRESA